MPFFAFPSSPDDLMTTITAAVTKVNEAGKSSVHAWPDMRVFGQMIPDLVRDNIKKSDVFIFDVTRPNLNVYYEAGFAVGSGKAIAPVVNASFTDAVADIQRDGFFDNLGYRRYENSQELSEIISDLPAISLLSLYAGELDSQQPLFVLDTLKKTDFRNAVVSAVKASKVHFRSFDPVEIPRLSSVAMIGQVTKSSGVVLPIIPSHIEDAFRHNLRAAFIAGLGHGLERHTLMIESARFDVARPADFRDLITRVADDNSIATTVQEFCVASMLATQSVGTRGPAIAKSPLQKLTLGSSAAENEFRTLSSYFVETAEYGRTLRGEVSVVAGRKGSGKTAIFFQVRDSFRDVKTNIVTDLKPESHQLTYFRQELLKIVDIGAFDHTLAAFWYFLILSEILLTISKDHEYRAKYDSRKLSALQEIEQLCAAYDIGQSGDFTTRINRLGRHIIQEIQSAKSRRQAISAEFLTNVIFRGGITEIRKTISKHANSKERIVVLFDNIDKGWPAAGIEEIDVRLVRLLVETLDKIKRDFSAAGQEFMSVVFLRNDIYEMLVEGTPDRGKAGQVRIDWTDRAKLKQVIYRRLQSSTKEHKKSFEQLWLQHFTGTVNGSDTFEYFIDHCLMRPRFLINIIENAIANAINRGHGVVKEEDCVDAVRQHSLYLVDDFGFEIRDVSGLSAEILYSLVGVERVMERKNYEAKFVDGGLTIEEATKAFDLMLWYGVLGIRTDNGAERFIYDYEYNMKRLAAEARSLGSSARYVTNAALHVALIN